MNIIALYMHAGSGNHGCEAIVDSLTRLLEQSNTIPEGERVTLVTYNKDEDTRYLPASVREHLSIAEENHFDRNFFSHAFYYAIRKLTGDRELFLRLRLSPIMSRKVKNASKDLVEGRIPKVAVSIGGDNYCYPSMVPDLMLANSALNRQGTKTLLIGCSIEPDLLEKGSPLLDDLALYQKILARESITYNALLDAGLPKEKVALAPDPAFFLPADEDDLPADFETGNTVGINLSPMALDYAGGNRDAVLAGYKGLIQHILDETNMQVALIPHVIWSRSDDRAPLKELHEAFAGNPRVMMIEETSAEKLKGIIANCRFFIGARTHSTIAAYSTLVPTLVIGYSVKARGIAEDLFGTSEHYVLPVQALTDPKDIIEAFDWLYRHEDEIHYTLAGAIPLYLRRAEQNADLIRQVLATTEG